MNRGIVLVFIATFCGLMTIQLVMEQNIISPHKAILFAYLFGFFLGCGNK